MTVFPQQLRFASVDGAILAACLPKPNRGDQPAIGADSDPAPPASASAGSKPPSLLSNPIGNRLAHADQAVSLRPSARAIEIAQPSCCFDRALMLPETFL